MVELWIQTWSSQVLVIHSKHYATPAQGMDPAIFFSLAKLSFLSQPPSFLYRKPHSLAHPFLVGQSVEMLVKCNSVTGKLAKSITHNVMLPDVLLLEDMSSFYMCMSIFFWTNF